MTTPILQRYPAQAQERPLERFYLEHGVHKLGTAEAPFVYGNFVSSLDGRIALVDAPSGVSYLPGELTNPNDFRLFLELQAQADCLSLGYKSLYLLTGPRMLETMLRERVLSRLYVTITHHIMGGKVFLTLTPGPELKQAGRLRLRSLYYDPTSPAGAGQWFARFEPAV